MSSKNQNLSDYSINVTNAEKLKIGVVVSDYNDQITHQLLDGCRKTLLKEGILESHLWVIHVPGAYELPSGARMLDDKHNLDAIIVLGCVIKGDTKHDEYISQAVATGLMQLAVLRSKPFIFGVLTPNTQEQALERSGGSLGNKGIEAAVTALKMASLKIELKSSKKQIGFS